MDQLTCIRTFVAVVQTGSFSAAARRLGRSPAIVTKHVQKLERHMGARLLNRTTRQVNLTEAGTIYWRYCRQVLEDLERAETEVGSISGRPRGRLRITAPYDFGIAEIEPLTLGFMQRYPEVTVDLLLVNHFVDLIEEGFDLAVRIARQLGDPALTARRFASSRLVVCAAPAYLRKRTPRTPDDLERHDCLLYTGAAWREEWPFTRAGETHKVRLAQRLLSNDNAFLTRAAVEGVGVTIQPSFNVWRELRAGTLRTVLDDWDIEHLRLNVVFPHGRYLPAKVRSFVDFLVETFDGASDRDPWLERCRTRSPARSPAPRKAGRAAGAGASSPRRRTG